MSEYISKQDMLNAVEKLDIIPSVDGMGVPTDTEDFRVQFLGTVLKVEPADVVQVVRCRDCKYNTSTHKCLNPDSFFLVPKDNDFCSYGERKERSMVTYKKNELYQEMELFNNDGVKIGEAEVDIEGKMLSRFVIYEPYQNQGYGTEFVTALCKDFGITSLWVNADNSHAIHVYEKCGFKLGKPKMYEMTKQG